MESKDTGPPTVRAGVAATGLDVAPALAPALRLLEAVDDLAVEETPPNKAAAIFSFSDNTLGPSGTAAAAGAGALVGDNRAAPPASGAVGTAVVGVVPVTAGAEAGDGSGSVFRPHTC